MNPTDKMEMQVEESQDGGAIVALPDGEDNPQAKTGAENDDDNDHASNSGDDDRLNAGRDDGNDDDEDRDEEALEDDDAHRARGIEALRGEGEGDDPVDPEACGQRERVVADDAHRDRHDPADEGGPGGDSRGIQPERLRDDVPVQEDDVGHDQEGGQAGACLDAELGLALGELEIRRDRVHSGDPSSSMVRTPDRRPGTCLRCRGRPCARSPLPATDLGRVGLAPPGGQRRSKR